MGGTVQTEDKYRAHMSLWRLLASGPEAQRREGVHVR